MLIGLLISPLIMRATPPELIGRVSSVLQLASELMSLASIGVVAWLAGSLVNLNTTVAGVHLSTIFLVAGAAITTAGLRTARALRSPDTQPQDSPDAQPPTWKL